MSDAQPIEPGEIFVKFMVKSRSNGVLAYLHELSKSGILVLLALAAHIGENNECFPSMRTIARESGCPIGTVKRVLPELEKLGLIEIFSHGGPKGHVNRYRVNPLLFQYGRKRRG